MLSSCCIGTGSFALLAFCASAIGCAHRSTPAPSPVTTTSASIRRPTPAIVGLVHIEEDDADDDPRGVLVIGSDVVDGCPGVRGARAPRGEEAMLWLFELRAIAACVERRQPGTIVLRGPSRPQLLMKFVFVRLGVPEGRVELTQVEGQRTCADDECAPQDLRVEISLGGTSAVSGVPPIARVSRVGNP
jgi:hypothetical protein